MLNIKHMLNVYLVRNTDVFPDHAYTFHIKHMLSVYLARATDVFPDPKGGNKLKFWL